MATASAVSRYPDPRAGHRAARRRRVARSPAWWAAVRASSSGEPLAGDELQRNAIISLVGCGARQQRRRAAGLHGEPGREDPRRGATRHARAGAASCQAATSTRRRWAAARRDPQAGDGRAGQPRLSVTSSARGTGGDGKASNSARSSRRRKQADIESRQQVMSCAGERRSAVVGQGDRQADGQSHARVMGCSRRIHAAQDRAQRTRGPPERCKGSVMAPKLHHRDRLSIARAYVCTTGSRGLSCGFGRGHAPAAGAAIDLRTLPIASRI